MRGKDMGNFIQFDNSKTIVGDVNIAEAKKYSKKLVFNETYTITGNKIIAPSVYASYDLTVVGDMEVKDIEVKGNLYVMGNIKAKNLSCAKVVICSGTIHAETILANEIVANEITCDCIECPGNVVARTTIDINESLKSNSSVMTGEGIVGSGHFEAKNAVTAEYFNFDGTVLGRVMELETETEFGKPIPVPIIENENVEELSSKLKTEIIKEMKRAGDIDNEHLLEAVKHFANVSEICLSDWKVLMENLIELSYTKEIINLRDYLIVIMAAKYLPVEILRNDSIKHVFDKLLVDTLGKLETLSFRAKNVADFAYAVKIVMLCNDVLMLEEDKALNRIFESIGIKYNTVKKYLG